MPLTLPNLPSLIHETRNAIAIFDETDRLHYANPAFRAALHLAEEDYPTWVELMRRGWQTSTGTHITSCNGDFEKWLSSALSRRGKLPFRGFETSLHDGRWIWVTETVDAHGWMLYIGVEITSLATEGRELRSDRDVALRASQTDELTGIANRRYMMQRLDNMVSNRIQGCVAILDIDHFKSINDAYGHAGGDAVLVDFARKVGHSVRRGDDFGRIGGEEFLFLLPDIEVDNAGQLLDRIRHTLLDACPILQAPEFRYTVSIGITAIQAGDSTQSLLSRADKACYEAKRQGRNRSVCM
ncbi:diguanylate cyclase (GGDEF) domain-containing protein [Methylophilus rhizosphaerae]|uniref:diguanylate cyclase n=1 Tax=Methylophilus rhizosphaerae TaxID=492660 RepID=A0A1G9B716_9PROT|nr:GGDEF domain-containing protein [Methylophilus rhizosphaerae]SDK34874.1 diguanylate cyclase (GGDEF) domain-containing protein [Methylophilus rhizosphaerae]